MKLEANKSIIFGPVPSRRLGRSIGINNIPPKICTYSCAYCQLGHTIKMNIARQVFYKPEDILHVVQAKVEETRKAGEPIDYLTFVPDGEPTLDINLEQEIELLKPLNIPIAVITNSSLIWQKEARNALMKADWVSLKVDAVEEKVWRQVDHPYKSLRLTSILKGVEEFAHTFKGMLVTETMLLANINDTDQNLREVSDFISLIQPTTAYLSIPIRPPAAKWAQPPDESVINNAYQIFDEKVKCVEYLTGYEGNAFTFTGNIEEDLLSITAVHPMRDDAVEEFLERAGANWTTVHRLVENGLLIETEYGRNKFYLRRFSRHHGENN